jgi:hypothetical protein
MSNKKKVKKSEKPRFNEQIWLQNFGPKKGKWIKVFLGPNYKTWAHMRLGLEIGQRALF